LEEPGIAPPLDRVRHAFLVAEVGLSRQDQRHLRVRRLDPPHLDPVVAGGSFPVDVPDQHRAPTAYAASGMPANASRTHAWVSHMVLRRASRTEVMGPLPLTTCQNSSQSGSDQSHSPASSLKASFSSGTEMPRSHSLGT